MNSINVAIENLYKAFSDVARPKTIDACSHCFEDHEIKTLLSKDLRELSPDDLGSYASSAFLTAGDVGDYLYFLPRILEISITDRWWWPDIEVTGRALNETDLTNWPAERQQALKEFFKVAIGRFIESEEYEEIDEWICGAGRAGVDVLPLLAIVEENPDAVVHYVNKNFASLLKGKLSNNFWEADDKGCDEIINWMRSDNVRRIYEEAMGRSVD